MRVGIHQPIAKQHATFGCALRYPVSHRLKTFDRANAQEHASTYPSSRAAHYVAVSDVPVKGGPFIAYGADVFKIPSGAAGNITVRAARPCASNGTSLKNDELTVTVKEDVTVSGFVHIHTSEVDYVRFGASWSVRENSDQIDGNDKVLLGVPLPGGRLDVSKTGFGKSCRHTLKVLVPVGDKADSYNASAASTVAAAWPNKRPTETKRFTAFMGVL